MPTVAQLLADARQRLARASFVPAKPPAGTGEVFRPTPREAALLLGHLLGWTEAQVLARDDRQVPGACWERFEELLQRRLRGEPVAYLLAEREFYGRDFFVDARVLIPRPETEHLVERALEACGNLAAPRILDVGAGSGCVAVTLAAEVRDARVSATDICPAALAVAATNARRHGVRDRLTLLATDVADGLEVEAFDLVVSNPPYIDPAAAPELSPEVTTYEPSAALFAADAGTRVIRRLLQLGRRLRPGTPILFEIGHDQSERLEALAAQSGSEIVDVLPDYAGIRRIAVGRACGPVGSSDGTDNAP